MKITPVAIYICDRCHEEIAARDPSSHFGNYGSLPNGDKHCYPCCAEVDREYMIFNGAITLYLSSKPNPDYRDVGMNNRNPKLWTVGNWPGSLEFKVIGGPGKSRHNMARWRYDVWFAGPDGHIWHGYQCGDDTQICHCKRTKQTVASLRGK